MVPQATDWAFLARRYAGRLRAVARRTYHQAGFGGMSHEAEDLVQETWLRLYSRWGETMTLAGGDDTLYPYLARTTRNLALDRVRAHRSLKRGGQSRHEALDESRVRPRCQRAAWSSSESLSPEEATLRRESCRMFLERCRPHVSVGRPRRDLAAVELAWLRGWTSRQIATVLGCTANAIDTLLHRVRRGLEGEGVALPARRG